MQKQTTQTKFPFEIHLENRRLQSLYKYVLAEYQLIMSGVGQGIDNGSRLPAIRTKMSDLEELIEKNWAQHGFEESRELIYK